MMQNYRPSSGLTPAVKVLLIINVAIWLATIAAQKMFHIDLDHLLGLHLPQSSYWGIWQYVTHMFMHASVSPYGHIEFTHIFFNMFALFMFGRILETVWGSKRFLIFYFVCGIGAGVLNSLVGWFETKEMYEQYARFMASPNPTLLSDFALAQLGTPAGWVWETIDAWINNPTSEEYIAAGRQIFQRIIDLKVNVPMIGASGAIFGILLAFGMLFPNTELFLMFIPIPIKAKYAVVGYGLLELFLGMRNAAGDNVAHFAHLGGMLFGFLLIKWWNRRSKRFY